MLANPRPVSPSYAVLVPLEGHWARQNSSFIPSSRRESVGLLIAVVVVTLVSAATLLAIVTDSHPAPAAGCERQVVAMSMGGVAIEHCPGRR
jgi:hypothetical protein